VWGGWLGFVVVCLVAFGIVVVYWRGGRWGTGSAG